MKKLTNFIKKNWSVITYLIFGALTTVINFVVFGALYTWHNAMGLAHPIMGYQAANFVTWLLSVLFAYITNKLWVFDSHQTSKKGVVKELESFFFWRIISYFMDVVILWLGIGILHGNGNIVKLIDQVVVVIANYAFSKIFIFKDQDNKKSTK